MVIGKGLVARNFVKYASIDEFLIFASGVSNSKSCTPEDVLREQVLLTNALKEHPSKIIVYFGTTSVYDPDLLSTPYIRHKLQMEDLVRSRANRYQIFRVSNLAGLSENPNTILNYFYSCITFDRPFTLWKRAERNIIDVDDVFRICDTLLGTGQFMGRTVNIANQENYPTPYMVRCIEAFTHKKARYTIEEKGEKFTIDISDILPTVRSLGITFGEDYLPKLLNKYYSK